MTPPQSAPYVVVGEASSGQSAAPDSAAPERIRFVRAMSRRLHPWHSERATSGDQFGVGE